MREVRGQCVNIGLKDHKDILQAAEKIKLQFCGGAKVYFYALGGGSSIFVISSKVLPFVSGIKITINIVPAKQKDENKYMAPYSPKNGKNCKRKIFVSELWSVQRKNYFVL